jgi:phage FluMu gp28-like protein
VTEKLISPQLAFLVEYLDLPEATGDSDAIWEAFQLKHLNNLSLLAIELKSRQVGWSWLAAAEAVAIGAITPRSTSIFVSINQEEAGEKIRYAKHIIECLDSDARPQIIRDNRFELEFANSSRLISHPCRPVRGKAKARVYLDEFAHYPNDREIYQSALPVISKGGCIRIGSSPLGAQGMFWEIYAQTVRPYPGYRRQIIPWWLVRAMSIDMITAGVEAPGMATEDRVERFGTLRLKQIFQNMPLDDFQQEYECLWVDEAVAWIDWNLIKRNQVLAGEDRLWYRKVSGTDAAFQAIDELIYAVQGGRVEDVLTGGMDVGRTHDTSEITLTGMSTSGQMPYRLGITLDRVEFSDQFAVASKLLDVLPITLFLVDKNGLGMQLAEDLNKAYGDKAQGLSFDSANKELLAVETKLRFQRAEAPIPLERDLAYQIHSIKKTLTSTKLNKYDTVGNEKHHADKFWSLALAIFAGKEGISKQAQVSTSPTFGYRG